MKNVKIGIILLSLVLITFGCSKDESLNPRLEISEEVFSFNDAITRTLAIEATGHWVAELIKDSSEFILSPSAGEGNGEVTITLNRSKAENINGYLKITNTSGTNQGVELVRGVKLLAGRLDMEVDPANVTFYSAIGFVQQSLQVKIEGRWTATLSDTTWCSVDHTTGEGEGPILLAVKKGVDCKGKSTKLIITPVAFPRVKYVVNVEERHAYAYGEYVVLNQASVGKGIDVVVLGDFFTKEDLKEGGRWEQACQIFMKHFFALEPYKSYRDYFNVYAVAYPNDRDLWFDESVTETAEEIETPFASYHAGGKYTTNGITATRLQKEAAYKYAYEHTPVKADKGTLKDMVAAIAVNTNWARYGVLAWSNNVDQFETCGMSVTPIAMFPREDLTSMFGHEILGHGFGDFHENYTSYEGAPVFTPQFPKEWYLNHQRRGIWQDMEFSNNPDEFINRTWAELLAMNYRNVYVVEGCMNFKKGVWRSSYMNVMKGTGVAGTEEYYSPVQRELIVRKIYRLAGLEYSLQTFLDYDVINKELDERMMELHNPKSVQ